MDITINRDALCPPPDPAPHAPSRFVLPPGAVDTHAHLVGEHLVAERSYTPPPEPRPTTCTCSTPSA